MLLDGKILCNSSHCNFGKSKRRLIPLWFIFGVISLNVFFSYQSFSQNRFDYDEIPIFLNVHRVGGTELPSVITEHEVLLSITDLFNFIKIKNTSSPDFDSVSGFFISPAATYLIDRSNYIIKYKEKIFHLKKDDLIQIESNLYLKSKYFGEVFGLECTFNYRSLMVSLFTKNDLPIIREMQQKTIRENIDKLKGIQKVDTIIGRSYPLFSFGMFDWAINSSQQVDGVSNTRIKLATGFVLAGGETNLVLNINSSHPIAIKDQYYRWRFANNDFKFVKQIVAGHISTYATARLYSPLVGLQITNTPTTFRRYFGTYTLSDYTQPDWTVELYVNNVLVNYTVADASGFFSFNVPLVYGNTYVALRFYGPWGEEKVNERSIRIPYNFVPKNEFEYRVSAGIVQNRESDIFSRGELSYGVGRYMTIGAGVEYLSSISTGTVLPFVNTNISLAGKWFFTGNYTHGVQTIGMLSYNGSSGLQMELKYNKYTRGQTAISQNYDEIRKFMIALPIRKSKLSLFTRLTLRQYIMSDYQFVNAELLLSGSIFGASTNITTFAYLSPQASPYIYSNISMVFALRNNMYIRPQVQYRYNDNKLISARVEIEKRFLQFIYLTAAYEEGFSNNNRKFQIGVRLELPFAQTNAHTRIGSNHISFYESAMGSIQFEEKTGYLHVNNNTSIGRGGIIILPFLDINNNGCYDDNEHKVEELNIWVSSGRISQKEIDTLIIISDLESYTKCIIKLGLSGNSNIAWKIKKPIIKVAVNPNQFRVIEVPISVMGEASGTIYKKTGNKTIKQSRVYVNFHDNNGKLNAQVLSEEDGYFNYLGLSPGKYTVSVDSKQLFKLKMNVSPKQIPITILVSEEGDIIENLDFVITKKKHD